MAMSNEDLLKELSAKPIMEVVELVKMLEDEWGVSAAAPVAVAAGPALPAPMLVKLQPRRTSSMSSWRASAATR